MRNPPSADNPGDPRAIAETAIEPELPIIDSHQHLWFLSTDLLDRIEGHDSVADRAMIPFLRRRARYLFDDCLADLNTGHNIRATVYVDCGAMYRSTGPERMRSVGEVEFVNGIAAMAESGLFSDIKVGAGIVGGVDLRLGAAVEEVLLAHIRAGNDRYRGVRSRIVYDEDSSILGTGIGTPGVLTDSKFREGFGRLQKLDLSFDAWLLEPQLPELIELARAFPETQIILNHVGAPVGIGQYAGQREARFPLWRERVIELSRCENVTVKLGGLGIPFGGFKSYGAVPPMTSAELAAEWKPYIETCIEAFGAERCMFESNFPVDAAACTYPVLWNAFKRLVIGASKDEKRTLFSETAKRIYRLDI